MVILASGSKWRKRLLKKHGIACRVYVTNFDELKKHRNPSYLALYNARGKALLAAAHFEKGIIIGVDTIGVLRGQIITKPRDRADARRMLLQLAGRTHEVISGLCVVDAVTGRRRERIVATRVTFKKILPRELAAYLASNQWKGKAGSYAIQGRAKKFIKKIDGDITNVIGLPIETLRKILKLMRK